MNGIALAISAFVGVVAGLVTLIRTDAEEAEAEAGDEA